MLEDLVSATLADPLAAARAHVEGGGRAIGLVGAEVPAELVLGAGAFPVQLAALPFRATPEADAYLERGFSPTARLVLQAWIDGDLDFFDAIVLPRSNDNAQRLYYYTCELRRRGRLSGPEPLLYDLSKIDRTTSTDRNLDKTAALAERLDVADASGGVAQVDRRRRLFARLTALQPAWSSVEIARLLRASSFADWDAFDAALATALDEPKPARGGTRLLLAGSAPPDEALHCAVEAGGGSIVAQLDEFGLDRHGPTIGDSADPIAAIAAAYHALPSGTRSFVDRATITTDAIAAAQADAVIVWLVEEEEALIWDLPAQIRAIEALGLPLLSLTRAASQPDAATLARITEFTASIGAAR